MFTVVERGEHVVIECNGSAIGRVKLGDRLSMNLKGVGVLTVDRREHMIKFAPPVSRGVVPPEIAHIATID